MEVDGRKLKKPLNKISDKSHGFPCSPCAKEGKNVAAVKQCVECDENLCKKCLSDHNKFAVMGGHQLLDTVRPPSGKRLELPSQRCHRHGGKLIDVYCPYHDKVGCSTCMTTEHSGCAEICFIPDIACKSETSKEFQLLEIEISKLWSHFLSLKQKKQQNVKPMRKEKSQLFNEIKLERKRINEHLDKMEAELAKEVDANFKIKLNTTESDIKEVDATIKLLQENLQEIDDAKNENTSEKYVRIKCINETKRLVNVSLDKLEKPTKVGSLLFEPSRQVSESDCNSIGKLLHLPVVEVEGSCDKFDLKIESDKGLCEIINMCLGSDDSLAIVDFSNKNKRIKKVNDLFEVTSSLTVSDNPFGICSIDSSSLAVTLINDRKVQFISQNEPMKLQQSFNVGDRCRGIAYDSGLIYVCCDGSKKRNEGVGHIEVYTVSGTLLTSLYGETEGPAYITVHPSSSDIYVSDKCKGILVLQMDPCRQTKNISLNKRMFRNMAGLCWINESLLCVAFCESNNVLLLSTDGKIQEELLSGKDGFSKPFDVCFNRKTSKLFVSQPGCDKILVFTLKINI